MMLFNLFIWHANDPTQKTATTIAKRYNFRRHLFSSFFLKSFFVKRSCEFFLYLKPFFKL